MKSEERIPTLAEDGLCERTELASGELGVTLLDLHPGTRRYVPDEDGSPVIERLAPDKHMIRILGFDIPVDALTMIGYVRLCHLERCVRTVVAEDIPGDLIETGVWRGGACILMRAVLGDDERLVWAADSYEGFNLHDFTVAYMRLEEHFVVPVSEVRENFQRCGVPADRVKFLKGDVAETLPALGDHRWSLIRLDADTYPATLAGLEYLYPNLSPGGFCIVDDYHSVEESRNAVHDYFKENEPEVIPIDMHGVYWRKGREE